jgi:hypothetical protein
MTASNAMEVNPDLNGSGPAPPQIVALRSVPGRPEPERIDAFSINGKVYSINPKPKTNAALKYVHLARTRGNEIAIDFMLETLLGREGYEALMDFDDLSEDQLEQVITAASKIMAGALENPKGKPGRASRRSPG